MSPAIDLAGKVALVTGGARGIGRACSAALARAGATVVVNYHRARQQADELVLEIAARGGAAAACQADIAAPEQVLVLFEQVRQRFGRLDILVNNAGIVRDKLLLSMELADWDRVQEVNLRGAFLCTRQAVELMLPQHAGKIVNVASVAALRCARGQANYAAAKGGLLAFTRACAVELAGKGIQVNAVLPGLIATAMSERVRRRGGGELLQAIPAARFGEPEEVAGAVLFLASASADYLTGQELAVDGGMSVA
jgi:3-oxoacyl-[acyl-carrier protein] reductase